MRAREDLELVPAVYLLTRWVIGSYAAKALGSIRAREMSARDN